MNSRLSCCRFIWNNKILKRERSNVDNNNFHQYNNDGNGLIDSIRTTLNRFVSHNNSKDH